MAKRHLYRRKHPFDIHPFEAFSHGSWRTIDHVRIGDGRVAMCFESPGTEMDEEAFNDTLRIRSRKATSSDCTCFLRPGVDVCVLLADPTIGSDKKILKLVWIDAEINSVERRPHESECTCRFHVTCYTTHRPQGKGKAKLRMISDVGIDQIAIIQKLQRKPCEDGYYRWNYSQDCRYVDDAKLFRSHFSSDISWLLVASILKELKFDIRSIERKIVYRMLSGDDHDECLLDASSNVAINFQMNNGILKPVTRTFIPVDTSRNTIDACPVHDLQEEDSMQLYDTIELRRSKRRNVQPDRFVSYSGFSNGKPSIVQEETGKINRLEENKTMSIVLLEADNGHLMDSECFRQSIDGEEMLLNCNGESVMEDCEGEKIVDDLNCENMVKDTKVGYRKKSHVKQSNIKRRGFLSDGATQMENQILLLENCEIDTNTAAPYGRSEVDGGLSTGVSPFSFQDNKSWKNKRKSKSPINKCTVSILRATSEGSDVPLNLEGASMSQPEDCLPIQILENPIPNVARSFSNPDHRHGSSVMEKRSISGKRFREMKEKRYRQMKLTWKVKGFNKKPPRRVSNLFRTKSDMSDETRTRRRAYFSASESKKMVESFMNNIESAIKREHPHASARWEEMRSMNCSNHRWSDKWKPPLNEQQEHSELEALWKEMELLMATVHFSGESQNSQESGMDSFDEVLKKSSNVDRHSCQHKLKLDEEIGLVCQLCSYVSTEIRYVSLPFLQNTGWTASKGLHNEDILRRATDGHEDLSTFCNPGSSKEIPLSERSDNVWALIPEFRMKLHFHQKKAFEFLWKNIVGSLSPAEMESRSKRTGGCVISHTPGAGKTLVVIAFLASYLKMFPGKRPLILTPKTTLYTWYKEMKKWDVPFPVYQINVRANFRHEIHNHLVEAYVGDRRPTQCDLHVMDCLEKIQKWHEHPSILLMGYTTFLSLTRDGSKYEHRRYMGRILRQSPGILVLDEGHNPRSTRSRLRKALMKVKTDLRILLSGTLFQNNFIEYFNTLCLARPVFIYEVIRKLDPDVKYRKGTKCSNTSMEKLARRLFIEKIAKKIKSKVVEERRRGLNMLRKITKRFIDVYEGRVQDSLPGLQSYTLLMKSTIIQQDLQTRLQNQKVAYKGYPLELELLITLVSIHPWLITTVGCVDRYFTMEELQDLEKHRLDIMKGSKVRFVVSLVQRCIMKTEKVLIFAHNIAPISLFVEIFEMIFGWQMGEQVLVLHGDQELYERARVMDKFEEPEGPSRVLLASITACAEGISLTAASRVVLLDSEWNPSKTKQAIARAFRPGQERMVYVYQLLASGTLEEEKYGKTTWKEWVSSMIFSEAMEDDSSRKMVENIDDEVLREIVEDQDKLFHMIMKHDKLSNGLDRSKAAELFQGR